MTQTLEDRIRLLEDIEAIKVLKASYCAFADAGIAGDAKKMDEFLDLFTEDITADLGLFGVYEGKKAVTQFFKETCLGLLSYTSHMTHNPIIHVEGDKAQGSWYFDCPCTVRPLDKAAWMHGRYEENYVKIEGKWKIKTYKVIFEYLTPFDEGWVKTRIISL